MNKTREILFKAKRVDNGKWVEGYFGIKGETAYKEKTYFIMQSTLSNNCETSYFTDYEVDPTTVCQFTGLCDENNKMIFEGDIIRYADEGEYRMYLESLECPEEYEGVDFSDMWTIDSVVYGIEIGYPAFDLNNHEWECNGISNLNESYQYFYEVIGNIHDNPELLE